MTAGGMRLVGSDVPRGARALGETRDSWRVCVSRAVGPSTVWATGNASAVRSGRPRGAVRPPDERRRPNGRESARLRGSSPIG